MIIYKAYCKATGKSFIGASTAKLSRIRHRAATDARRFGLHQNDTLLSDILRYGIQNTLFTLIETLPDSIHFGPRLDYWISYFNTLHPHGYNYPIEHRRPPPDSSELT